MTPGPDAPNEAPTRPQGRRVQLFIAAHLLAVGATYALALFVGGGFAGPPMPPTLAVVPPAPAPAAPVSVATVSGPQTREPVPLPSWTQRAEIASPWETR